MQFLKSSSHNCDCPLSLYDMYLQHGNVGIGYSYLMFLAYKAIAQKPSSFFEKYCDSNHFNFYKLKSCQQTEVADSNNLSVSTNENEKNIQNGKPMTHDKIEDICILGEGRIKNSDPPVGVSDFNGYDIFFNMVTHVKKMSVYDIFERIILSIFLLNCLETTNYFSKDKKEKNKNNSHSSDVELERRIMFVGLIFHAYSVILPNNHSVGEVDSSELNGFVGIKRNIVGNCVFARVASVLNHSCDPNTSPVYIKGNTQVICN